MEKRVSFEGKEALFQRVFAYDEDGELIEPYKEVDEGLHGFHGFQPEAG